MSTAQSGQDLDRPNIIFILTDDQRWDALGYAGNPIIQTPEMDRLATEGAFFKQALVTTPICAASRASIFTGLYERTHKYTFQTGGIRGEYMQSSYPKLLREAGYYTGFYGKFGVNYNGKSGLFDVMEDYDRNNRYRDHRGYYYKELDGEIVHLTRYTGERAMEFIDQAPEDQPFCLSISFSAPHAHDGATEQYFWQDKQDPLYRDMEMPKAAISEDVFFNQLPLPVREGFNRLRWTWRYDTPEKYQHSVKGYYRMIKGIDNEIASIRKKLAEKGLDQNTVIMLMGDNGYFLGERQLAGKWLMYDNSIRVPLIIYDPRADGHKDIDDLALNVDIPSTILDLADIPAPDSWHGKSLLPMIYQRDAELDREAVLIEHLWEFTNIPPSEGVRTHSWKYMRYVNDKSAEELYDLASDPREINNLAGDDAYRSKLQTLQAKCDELAQKYADPLSGKPSHLMVEYIRDPAKTLIVDPKPEFSWIVPKQAVFQKGYQILVSSTRALIDKNIGDVWNSGQVRGRQSTNISFDNKELKPHHQYFWKVRIWDKDNRLSSYSDTQMFRTGAWGETLSSANRLEIEKIAPVHFKETNAGYFIDFGRAAFGTLELNYVCHQPETLTIRMGEKLKDDQIDRDPGGTIRYQEVNLSVQPGQSHYVVELPADERNTGSNAVQIPDSFGIVMPFRYCEIEKTNQKIKPPSVVQRAYFHYFDYGQSSFTSSDSIVNQIWDICKYSMKATSFTGYYIDGDRERIPYEADAYINQLGHYGTDREYAMAKQTIEYFMKHPTWPTEWLLHTALMMYQDYYHSGDTELIAHYYDALKKKTLHELAGPDGLISSKHASLDGTFMQQLGFRDTTLRLKDIVDWPPAQADTGWKLATAEGERDGHQMLPVNTVVNCFYYANMKIMHELADLLQKSEDADYFALMAAKVKKAIQHKLFDQKKGVYIDGIGATHSSLHSNMLPLAFGLVPTKYLESVVAFVKSRGMACSVYGAQYLLEGLYRAGEGQYALDLMRATDDRSWWHMIEIGSTITLEAWDMKYKPNADWNHAWGAAPANIIPRWLWGIQPKSAGFDIVSIHPQMGDLTSSSIEVPTLLGKISADYQLVNNRLTRYEISLPANMVGEFHTDFSPQAVITLNGENANLSFGTIRLSPGKNTLEVKINSF